VWQPAQRQQLGTGDVAGRVLERFTDVDHDSSRAVGGGKRLLVDFTHRQVPYQYTPTGIIDHTVAPPDAQ
jgi:hypothetical protein